MAGAAGSVRSTIDRETLGKIGYEAYRESLNHTTDDTLPRWEWADHETQLAFRDAGESVARSLLPNMDNQPSKEAEKYAADMARFRDNAASVVGKHKRRPTRQEKADMLQLLNELADCYFTHRSEGLLELMMRADRLTSPNIPGSAAREARSL